MEGFDIYCLINQLSRNLDDVRLLVAKEFEPKSAYQFFKENTGNIEMVKKNDLIEIFFPIQPVCRKMLKSSKDKFQQTVNI